MSPDRATVGPPRRGSIGGLAGAAPSRRLASSHQDLVHLEGELPAMILSSLTLVPIGTPISRAFIAQALSFLPSIFGF